MRLLDLFCGAGGAAMGYSWAGFDDIVGVDIEPQPNYPFEFVQGDALEWSDFDGFDLIHASPPCQAYSKARHHNNHPQLVEPVRRLLAGYSHVIENVLGAGLRANVVLCGSMFGLQVQRHRAFEMSADWPLVVTPACNHLGWAAGRPHTVTGHSDGSIIDRPHSYGYRDLTHAQELMGMPWAKTKREVTEAIPPAYTEHLGRQFLAHLGVQGDEVGVVGVVLNGGTQHPTDEGEFGGGEGHRESFRLTVSNPTKPAFNVKGAA